MKIILSNDDGIDSLGLTVLAETLSKENEVTIIAPERERSAISHAITLREPVLLKRKDLIKGVKAYAATGTPADCMKIALLSFCDQPDCVLVGLNPGSNLSTDIVYSGTVAAASEARMLSVPAFAFSMDDSLDGKFHFETGAQAATELLSKIDLKKAPRGVFLNVNVPNVPFSEIKGFRLTTLGKTKFHERYLHRTDPSGNDYFWISGVLLPDDEDENSDYLAIKRNFISVTPLSTDPASAPDREEVKIWLKDLIAE
ncbi:5'/3'-nucleotidase SurE [bacterium]|nr:5'/3'-nucleotidase SurE [bacterium]